jgi:hypothetical protein
LIPSGLSRKPPKKTPKINKNITKKGTASRPEDVQIEGTISVGKYGYKDIHEKTSHINVS